MCEVIIISRIQFLSHLYAACFSNELSLYLGLIFLNFDVRCPPHQARLVVEWTLS